MYLIDLDTVTTGCEQDGLGIPNLGDMNVAFLVKWISCYGIEVNRY